MGRVDGLFDHFQDRGRQPVLVYFISQGGAEGNQHLFGIVPLTVKAPVDSFLNASAEGGKQYRDSQRGKHGGGLRALARERRKQAL